MKCPHCLDAFFANWVNWVNTKEPDMHFYNNRKYFFFKTTECPTCTKAIFVLAIKDRDRGSTKEITVYPSAAARLVQPEVDPAFADDFKEACLVIGDSEKASAALSRRCLQKLLIEKAGAKEKATLDSQIKEVIDSGKLPSHLTENIDAIRNIGNFAAHPIKSERTGEVIEVETGEAEWLLDTLEGLFDFYFVQPAKSRGRKTALNKKLEEAGKPQLKGGAAV